MKKILDVSKAISHFYNDTQAFMSTIIYTYFQQDKKRLAISKFIIYDIK